MKRLIKRLLASTRYKLVPVTIPTTPRQLNPDITDAEWATWEAVGDYTMTSLERILAAIRATAYVSQNRIPGDIVECGVWRGGSSMAMARTLNGLGDTSRRLRLYDTYEGMTPPTEADRNFRGSTAAQMLSTSDRATATVWAYATLEDVRANLNQTGYPESKIDFIKGPVEKTIPDYAPDAISILRLDTDWYESTKHELNHLYPRLSPGGVLIIDDYGHWDGARQAVDEFFGGKIYLNRIDYSGRLAIKP